MRTPTLSVIVPNYNHSKYLPACIEAIMTQSLPATEVIVIDDCSTDNSVAVIEELAKKHPTLKLVRNEVNRGVERTVNRGFELATSEYVLSTGADDQVAPGLFEKSLRVLAEHPQAALSASICRFEDTKTGAVYYLGADVADHPCYIPPEEMVERIRRGKLTLFTSTMIFRREVMQKAGFYQADLKWHSDWFVFMVCGLRHGVCFVPEALGLFRVIYTGYSRKGMRKMGTQMEVLRTILNRLEEKDYCDVIPRIRDSAALATFGKEMLLLMLRERRFRKYLTFDYLRRALWWTARIEAKRILPGFVAKLYFKLAGYSRTPKSDGV